MCIFPTLPDENTVINSMQKRGEGCEGRKPFFFFFFSPSSPRLEKRFWQIIWLNMKRERLLTAAQIKCWVGEAPGLSWLFRSMKSRHLSVPMEMRFLLVNQALRAQTIAGRAFFSSS